MRYHWKGVSKYPILQDWLLFAFCTYQSEHYRRVGTLAKFSVTSHSTMVTLGIWTARAFNNISNSVSCLLLKSSFNDSCKCGQLNQLQEWSLIERKNGVICKNMGARVAMVYIWCTSESITVQSRLWPKCSVIPYFTIETLDLEGER